MTIILVALGMLLLVTMFAILLFVSVLLLALFAVSTIIVIVSAPVAVRLLVRCATRGSVAAPTAAPAPVSLLAMTTGIVPITILAIPVPVFVPIPTRGRSMVPPAALFVSVVIVSVSVLSLLIVTTAAALLPLLLLYILSYLILSDTRINQDSTIS